MECVVFEVFVMAEGHLCITYGRILDAEVAFGHDKSHLRRDKYHFYIFMRKPFNLHSKIRDAFQNAPSRENPKATSFRSANSHSCCNDKLATTVN
jgi:hypothetical protein